MSNASSPLSETHTLSDNESNESGIVNNELEQLGVNLVDQTDLEKSLMEKVW